MESKNIIKEDKEIITGTVSDPSTPYLKKSELPKKVSVFTNDAGYLTKKTLEEWLNTHSYVKYDDIKSVIEEYNLEVNDDSINSIKSHINGIKGEIDEIKTHLKDNIIETVDKNYISIDKESNFATKKDVERLESQIGKIKIPDVSKFAKTSDVYDKDVIDSKIETLIERDEVKNTYLPKNDIENTYITKKDANNKFLTKEDYRGLKAGAIISDSYKDDSFEDIDEKLDSGVNFFDGFYIIDGGNSFVFIRNNEVVTTSGAGGENQLRWKKDTGKDYIKHN